MTLYEKPRAGQMRAVASAQASIAPVPSEPAVFRARAARDIRAVKFHPFTPEQTLVHTGRLALGLPVDEF